MLKRRRNKIGVKLTVWTFTLAALQLFEVVYTYPTALLTLAFVSVAIKVVDSSEISTTGAGSRWHRHPALLLCRRV